MSEVYKFHFSFYSFSVACRTGSLFLNTKSKDIYIKITYEIYSSSCLFKPWDSKSSAKSSLAFEIESRDEWITSSGITIHVCEAVVMWMIMFCKKGYSVG